MKYATNKVVEQAVVELKAELARLKAKILVLEAKKKST